MADSGSTGQGSIGPGSSGPGSSGPGSSSKPSLADKLKAYTAIAAAAAALIAALGAIYSQVKQSPIVGDIERIIAARPAATPAKFTLQVGGKHYADNPDDATIASAVRAAADRKEDPFVILSRSDREFMQAMDNKTGWELEYRAAEMEKPQSKPLLFGCTESMPIDKVIKALQLYRADDKAWTELCTWKRLIL